MLLDMHSMDLSVYYMYADRIGLLYMSLINKIICFFLWFDKCLKKLDQRKMSWVKTNRSFAIWSRFCLSLFNSVKFKQMSQKCISTLNSRTQKTHGREKKSFDCEQTVLTNSNLQTFISHKQVYLNKIMRHLKAVNGFDIVVLRAWKTLKFRNTVLQYQIR